MSNKNRTAPLEICLCARCVAPFYEAADHYVKRIDPYKTILEPCSICHNRNGYDYAIWDNSGKTQVRKERRV